MNKNPFGYIQEKQLPTLPPYQIVEHVNLKKERTELLIVANSTSPPSLPCTNNSSLCQSVAEWQRVCFASSPEQCGQHSCLDSLCP